MKVSLRVTVDEKKREIPVRRGRYSRWLGLGCFLWPALLLLALFVIGLVSQ